MNARIEANQSYLRDLFSGPFRGHAILMDSLAPDKPCPGDFVAPQQPGMDWLGYHQEHYRRMLACSEAIGDDAVPYVKVHTGTQLFASAFGCDVHIFPNDPPSARPLVRTAAEADRLPQPTIEAEPLAKVFEFAEQLRRRLGPDVPISVPDIQSPFDVAALIWNKEDFFVAMVETPDAVKRLAAKCHKLLAEFLVEFRRQFPNCNYCHCPYAWAPPELGCWLSEDEVGSMSAAMFEEFSLPILVDLSRQFGGLFVHCCATADHQYENFKKIPNLRGLNRVFQTPGPRPAIETFEGHTVFMHAWHPLEYVEAMLDLARPHTRFLFNMPYQPLDDARRTFERLRSRCPGK